LTCREEETSPTSYPFAFREKENPTPTGESTNKILAAFVQE
jgi:hypothetical protein